MAAKTGRVPTAAEFPASLAREQVRLFGVARGGGTKRLPFEG